MLSLLSRFLMLLFILVSLSGCRAWRSKDPAFHINPNLDWQAKFKTQSLAKKSPINTIPWGEETSLYNDASRADYLQNDSELYTGKTHSGTFTSKNPLVVDKKLIELGIKNFNIYCAACHTKTGNGTKSLISKRGWVIPNITLPSTQSKLDGELYDIIANGIRSMPAYSHQIEVNEIWSIVAYLRVLQKASSFPYNKLTKEQKSLLK